MRAKALDLALALAVVVTACRTAAPPGVVRVPDPLAPPPPGTSLTGGDAAVLHRALAAAERGDFVASERYLSRLPSADPASRLAALEVDFLRGKSVTTASLALAKETKSYAPAWRLAAQAARAEGRLADALQAARRGEELSSTPGGRREVSEIEAALVTRTLREGREALAGGDPGAALETARAAIQLVPDAVEVRELAVRSALGAGRAREAAEMLPSLPNSPEGIELQAQVAGALGQWQLAEELLRRLPADYPGRCAGILRARGHARLANAPPYLTQAVEADPLSRRSLAAILVWELPDLAGRQTGRVPVFEDVVQLPEQSDIITAVRCGLMRGDAVTRRFAPNRIVHAEELEAVLERLARLYGRATPQWCGSGAAPGCIDVPAAPTGSVAVALVRRVTEEEDGCR